MPDLQSTLFNSFSGLQLGMTKVTQAHMAIPTGIVRDKCQNFEARISTHQYEQDSVYIGRAARNMRELLSQKRTFAGRLRAAEDATLFELPQDLVGFLRDYDSLYRVAVRNRCMARRARASPDIDVVEQVTHRLNNIRTAYYLNFIETSGSNAERQRMMHDPIFISEFTECTLALQDEIVTQLTRLDALIPSSNKDLELDNIGPDHNIDDFGSEIYFQTPLTITDHSERCCICLSPWTSTHPPFRTSACAHIIGKPCLARWLNSTARNSNLCPCCRAVLCERRARKPKTVAVGEHEAISSRVGRAIISLGDFEKTQLELFGVGRADDYMRGAMEAINYRLFEGGVGFCMQCDWAARRWGVRRVRWH